MKAVVVFESMWGNTAEVAKAIAEGIGPDTKVMTTDQASNEAVKDCDLLVVGSPLLGFALPNQKMLDSITNNPANKPAVAGASTKPMKTWLGELQPGTGSAAAFETRIWWSPGSAAKAILEKLKAAGYEPVSEPQKFLVTDKYGPLKDGELARAREWGAALRA